MKTLLKRFLGKTPKSVKVIRNIALTISGIAVAYLNSDLSSIEFLSFLEPIANKAVAAMSAVVGFLAQFFTEDDA